MIFCSFLLQYNTIRYGLVDSHTGEATHIRTRTLLYRLTAVKSARFILPQNRFGKQ